MQEIGKHRACSHSMTLSDTEFIDLITNAPAVSGEVVARLHVTATDTYPDVDIEVLNGTNLQPSMSPIDVYLAAPQQAIPSVIVSVNQMKESNGNQWWSVDLRRNADDKAWDGIEVYTDKIEGRALYEAARLRHFFGQCEKPFILDFDTDPPASPTAPIESDK